jgi:hypothetical protein
MHALAQPATQPSPDCDKNFLGHPRGLAYLVFTEAWERFSTTACRQQTIAKVNLSQARAV